VPDVTGKSAEDAQNKLEVAGFALGQRQKTFDPTKQPGSVLSTSPAAGATAPKGSEVSLQIADALVVPDVRGSSTKDAVKTLEGAGFTVTVGDPAFDPDIDAGDILRTDPGPAALVDPDNPKIFLVPSNAVTVPDLTGGTVKQAQQKLDKLGLTMSLTSFFGGEDASVWDQTPGAGGRVAPGGTVNVTVIF
jgi:serine/threonine-protein kinase